MELSDSLKDDLADFFDEPDRSQLRQILRRYDAETDHLDFKRQWIDRPKLAKHVLAFANNGGGAILFGVHEDGDEIHGEGLSALTDKSDIAIDQYLPDRAKTLYQVRDFVYDDEGWGELEGKRFQVLFINDDPLAIPVVSLDTRTVQSGSGIKTNTIYVRDQSRSISATDWQVNQMLDRRITAELNRSSATLTEDLEQLEALYDAQRGRSMEALVELADVGKAVNPYSPDESFDEFILKTIFAKKQMIREELELPDELWEQLEVTR